MGREIKFRAKRIDTNEWVYGFYAASKDKNTCLIFDEDFDHEVHHETVCQLLFTTISGLELFNGDIFDIGQTVNGQSRFVIIQGELGIAIYYDYDRTRQYEYDVKELLTDYMGEIKFISNIHENK